MTDKAKAPDEKLADDIESVIPEEGLLKGGALLHTIRMMNVRRKPLMMEFRVPDTAPFLVTSSRSLFWVPRSNRGVIRAAVRPYPAVVALASWSTWSCRLNRIPPCAQMRQPLRAIASASSP